MSVIRKTFGFIGKAFLILVVIGVIGMMIDNEKSSVPLVSTTTSSAPKVTEYASQIGLMPTIPTQLSNIPRPSPSSVRAYRKLSGTKRLRYPRPLIQVSATSPPVSNSPPKALSPTSSTGSIAKTASVSGVMKMISRFGASDEFKSQNHRNITRSDHWPHDRNATLCVPFVYTVHQPTD